MVAKIDDPSFRRLLRGGSSCAAPWPPAANFPAAVVRLGASASASAKGFRPACSHFGVALLHDALRFCTTTRTTTHHRSPSTSSATPLSRSYTTRHTERIPPQTLAYSVSARTLLALSHCLCETMGLKTPRVYEQVLLDKFRPFVEQTLLDIKASKSNQARSRLLGSTSRGAAGESEELRRLTFEQWVDKVDFRDEYWQRLHDIIVDVSTHPCEEEKLQCYVPIRRAERFPSLPCYCCAQSFTCDRTTTPARYLESAHDQAARASTSSWAPMPRPSRYAVADSSDSDDAFPTINVRHDSGTSLRRTRSLRRVGRFQRTAAGELSTSTSRSRLIHDGADLQGVEVPPLLPWLGATTRATSSSFPEVLRTSRLEEPLGPTSAYATGLMSPRRTDPSTGEVIRPNYGPANYSDDEDGPMWPPEMDYGALVDDDLGEKVDVLYGALECYKYNMTELENSYKWQDRAFGRGVERIMPRMTALVEEMDGLRRLRRHWMLHGAGPQLQAVAGRDNRRAAGTFGGPSQAEADMAHLPALAPATASRSSIILPPFNELGRPAPADLPPLPGAAAASSTVPDDPSSWSWAMPPEELRALTPTSFEEFTALGRAAGRSRMRNSRRRRRGVADADEVEAEEQEDSEDQDDEEDRPDPSGTGAHAADRGTQG